MGESRPPAVARRRPTLTPETFATLLGCLDPDRERAGEKYEALRLTLVRFFQWRGAPFPDELADDTFDRVSKKLGDQIAIVNIGAHCYEVARQACLDACLGRLSAAPRVAGEPSAAGSKHARTVRLSVSRTEAGDMKGPPPSLIERRR